MNLGYSLVCTENNLFTNADVSVFAAKSGMDYQISDLLVNPGVYLPMSLPERFGAWSAHGMVVKLEEAISIH